MRQRSRRTTFTRAFNSNALLQGEVSESSLPQVVPMHSTILKADLSDRIEYKHIRGCLIK